MAFTFDILESSLVPDLPARLFPSISFRLIYLLFVPSFVSCFEGDCVGFFGFCSRWFSLFCMFQNIAVVLKFWLDSLNF